MYEVRTSTGVSIITFFYPIPIIESACSHFQFEFFFSQYRYEYYILKQRYEKANHAVNATESDIRGVYWHRNPS